MIVISPLVELMNEMVSTFQETNAAIQLGLTVATTHDLEHNSLDMQRISGLYSHMLFHFICFCVDGHIHLVYVSPESYTDAKHPLGAVLCDLTPQLLPIAIDEAHLCYQWGTNSGDGRSEAFRESFARLGITRSSFHGKVL